MSYECTGQLPNEAYSAPSESIGKHFAIDRYLSRGGTVDAAVPPAARLHYLRNRVDDCRLRREMDVVVRAWHWRVTFATAKKAAVARRWDCCHFSALHRGGPERAAPNILNNEKVFTVY